MSRMGVHPGQHTKSLHDMKDITRIKRLLVAAQESEKKKRKAKKYTKIVEEEKHAAAEGVTYGPGVF